MDSAVTDLEFRGAALTELRRFPAEARRETGFQLYRVQQGRDPVDWKPMTTIGPGVREIRIRGRDGAFRVIYLAKLHSTVYVLRCFQKKSQKTSFEDLAAASQRYIKLIQEKSL